MIENFFSLTSSYLIICKNKGLLLRLITLNDTHTHSVELLPKRNELVSEAFTCTFNTKYSQEKNINALVGIRNGNPRMPAATEIGVIVNYEMHIMATETTATNLIHFHWRSWRDWGKQQGTRENSWCSYREWNPVPFQFKSKHSRMSQITQSPERPRPHSRETELRFELCTSKSRALLLHTPMQWKPHHYSRWIHTVWQEN